MKTKILILFTVLLSVLFTSCRGYRETDSEYLISAVGFEKSGLGFHAYIEVLALSANESNSESKVFSSEGTTPFEAINNTVALLPRSAVFDHCTIAIIDEDMSAQAIKDIFDYLYDTRNLNLGIYLYVTEDVKKILSCKSQAISMGYDIMAIELNLYQATGVRCKNKYFEIESRAGDFILPKLSIRENRAEISGYSVYSNYRAVTDLSCNEGVFLELAVFGSKGGEINVSGKKCRIISAVSTVKKKNSKLYIKIKMLYKHKSDNCNRNIEENINKVFKKIEDVNGLNVLGFKGINSVKELEVTG